MTESLAIDSVRSFLGDLYGERFGDPEPVGAGEWSKAYAVSLNGRDMVVRFGAHVDDFLKDRIMGEHASPQLPIPKVLAVGAAPGGFSAVSERRRGDFLDELDGPGMRTVLPSLLATLDAIAAVDVSAQQGYGLWAPSQLGPSLSWPAWLLEVGAERSRMPGWRRALATSARAAIGFDRGLEALRQLVTTLPADRQLIHSDLLYRNVMVKGDRINAVYDWGNSLYGDHLYDAACLLYWWPWFPLWRDIDIRHELETHWSRSNADLPGLEHRLLTYQIHIGLDHMAYNALKGNWGYLARNVEQTAQLVAQAMEGI